MKKYEQKNSLNSTDEWYTPIALFKKLNSSFNFTLDPSGGNLPIKNIFSKETNGLSQKWDGNVYCNPPYSEITKWIIKAKSEWERERESNSITNTS